ncbi:MBL fold metallo-hydrolase [Lacisediminihabitans changchengi]|uniref:MBL fold metallo-hydrolase n=1 Tax=Lacisediminihabitans changchengi TaxID=2787634 RepID=A0A934SJX3_9MICO|nr:MBL fold metallo-hydrolase [Lacisediminihabitans changchengi]MBK4346272.1 MBL fold metallo-hydrolase [Lacisediminihabitans changchengi]
MRVTKQEHAALILQSAEKVLVVDPGSFTTALVGLSNVVGIVITHEHADHWTAEQLTRIIDRNPDAVIYGPAGVVAAASDFHVVVVEAGDTVTVEPFTLRFFGGEHAVIHSSIPVVDNLGVLVNDTLYYPGDSYTIPEGVEVDTLAAPVGAPWLKIGDAMDFVLAVKPRRAFAVHEMTLSTAGKNMQRERLAWATEQGGGEFFVLEPGESLDL